MPVLVNDSCKWGVSGYSNGLVGLGTQHDDAVRCEVCGKDGDSGHLMTPAFARELAEALVAAAAEAEARS